MFLANALLLLPPKKPEIVQERLAYILFMKIYATIDFWVCRCHNTLSLFGSSCEWTGWFLFSKALDVFKVCVTVSSSDLFCEAKNMFWKLIHYSSVLDPVPEESLHVPQVSKKLPRSQSSRYIGLLTPLKDISLEKMVESWTHQGFSSASRKPDRMHFISAFVNFQKLWNHNYLNSQLVLCHIVQKF